MIEKTRHAYPTFTHQNLFRDAHSFWEFKSLKEYILKIFPHRVVQVRMKAKDELINHKWREILHGHFGSGEITTYNIEEATYRYNAMIPFFIGHYLRKESSNLSDKFTIVWDTLPTLQARESYNDEDEDIYFVSSKLDVFPTERE